MLASCAPAALRGLMPIASTASAALLRGLAPALSSAVGSRRFAVDAKFRTLDGVHQYLDSLFLLKDKVALVTGAGGGVGSAVCLALAKCGADVVAADLTPGSCDALVGHMRDMGRRAEFVQMDVRDRTSVDSALEKVDKGFGSLQVLVANAGILGEMQLPQDTSEDNWRNIFATNVDGVFHVARAAHPLLKRGDHSKVVVTSSVAGVYGYASQAAYCASKGALIPLTKSLALAWAPDGINVNAVLPGAINTAFTSRVLSSPDRLAYLKERIALGRLAEPEDIAGPIVFFSSRAADYCTGSTLVVDGGGTSRAMAA